MASPTLGGLGEDEIAPMLGEGGSGVDPRKKYENYRVPNARFLQFLTKIDLIKFNFRGLEKRCNVKILEASKAPPISTKMIALY